MNAFGFFKNTMTAMVPAGLGFTDTIIEGQKPPLTGPLDPIIPSAVPGPEVATDEEVQLALSYVDSGSGFWGKTFSALQTVGSGAVSLAGKVVNTGVSFTASAAGNLVVAGALKILLRVQLSDDRRDFLQSKCQPFTDEALPEFTKKVAPLLADKLKELGWWVPSQNQLAEKALSQVPQDLILVLTSRIVNFFNPSSQLADELFDLSSAVPNQTWDSMSDRLDEPLQAFKDYEPRLRALLDNMQGHDIVEVMNDLQEIGRIPQRCRRNQEILIFAAKVGKDLPTPPIHPLAALISDLLAILRIEDNATLSGSMSKELNFLTQLILDQEEESRQAKLLEFVKATQEDFLYRKSEAKESQDGTWLGNLNDQEAAFLAIAKEVEALLVIEKEKDREVRLKKFVDQMARNYALSLFAVRIGTILLGEDGSALPLGGMATLSPVSITALIFSKLHLLLSRVLWQHAHDWLCLPEPEQVDRRYSELLNMASQAGQHYISSELDNLRKDPKKYEHYQSILEALSNTLYEGLEEHLSNDKNKQESVKKALQSSLQAILNWVKESDAVRQWVNDKVPGVLSFMIPHLAPLLKRVEENCTLYHQQHSSYLPNLCQDLQKLVMPPELAVELPLSAGEAGYQAVLTEEEDMLLSRVSEQRTNEVARLVGELLDICFKGDPQAKMVNLHLPPALGAFLYSKVKQLVQSTPDSPFHAKVLPLIKDYLLTAKRGSSDVVVKSFEIAHQAVLLFVQNQLKKFQEEREFQESCFTSLMGLVPYVQPFLPVRYYSEFATRIEEAVATVFAWILAEPDQLLTNINRYLPFAIHSAQALFAPVLQQMYENVKQNVENNPELVREMLTLLQALVKRPSYADAVGRDEVETAKKRRHIIEQKVEIALMIIQGFVDLLFRSPTTNQLNWPLAPKLREMLYKTVCSMVSAPSSASSKTPWIKGLLLDYLPLCIPVDYAPQEAEMTHEYRQACHEVHNLAAQALHKFLKDQLVALWLHPDEYENCRNKLVAKITALAAPYLPPEYEPQLQTFADQSICLLLDHVRVIKPVEGQPLLNALNAFTHNLESCLAIVTEIADDFLPVIFKQTEKNIEKYQHWAEVPKFQLSLLAPVEGNHPKITAWNSTWWTLGNLTLVIDILFGKFSSPLPIPKGLEILAREGAMALLEPTDESDSFLAHKLFEAFASYLIPPEGQLPLLHRHQFALDTLKFEGERFSRREVDSLITYNKENRNSFMLVFDRVKSIKNYARYSDFIGNYVQSFFEWIFDMSDKSPSAEAYVEDYLDKTYPYVKKQLAKDLEKDKQFFEVMKLVNAELDAYITYSKSRDYAAKQVYLLAAPYLSKENPSSSKAWIEQAIHCLFDWIGRTDAIGGIVDHQLSFAWDTVHKSLGPVLPQLEKNIRDFVEKNPEFVSTIADLAKIVAPIEPGAAPRVLTPSPKVMTEAYTYSEGTRLPQARVDFMEEQLARKLNVDKKASEMMRVLTILLDVALKDLPLPPKSLEAIRSQARANLAHPLLATHYIRYISAYLVADPKTSNKIIGKEQLVTQSLGHEGHQIIEALKELLLNVVLNNEKVTEKVCELAATKAEEAAEKVGKARYVETFNLKDLGIEPSQIITTVSNAVGVGGRQQLGAALNPLLHQALVTVVGNVFAPLENHQGPLRQDGPVLSLVNTLVGRLQSHVEFLWESANGAKPVNPNLHPVVMQNSEEAELAYFQEQSARLVNRLFGDYCEDLPTGKEAQRQVFETLMGIVPELLQEQIKEVASGNLQLRAAAKALLSNKKVQAAKPAEFVHPFGRVGGASIGQAATGLALAQTGLRLADMVVPGHGPLSKLAKMVSLDRWLSGFILSKVGDFIEKDASLQSQVLKLARFAMTQIPPLETVVLDALKPKEVGPKLSAEEQQAELLQMRTALHQNFYRLYRDSVTSGIDCATNGLALATRRAYIRGHAMAQTWAKNMLVCYDCRWIGQQARYMLGTVLVPPIFTLLNGLVVTIELAMWLLDTVLQGIYRGLTQLMWGKNWEQKQADRIMAILEDTSYKHLLFHIMDDLVDVICQDGAEPLVEAAIVKGLAFEQRLQMFELLSQAQADELPQVPPSSRARSGSESRAIDPPQMPATSSPIPGRGRPRSSSLNA